MIRLVPCAKLKTLYAAPAKDLYVSRHFRRARYYCELAGSPWFILSAKHGIVHPDTVLRPYELSLKTMDYEERAMWARMVLRQLPDMVGDYSELEMLCGIDYRDPLMPTLRRRFGHVVLPLLGMRIIERYKWFGKRIEELSRG